MPHDAHGSPLIQPLALPPPYEPQTSHMPQSSRPRIETLAQLGRWAISHDDTQAILERCVDVVAEELSVEFSLYLELLDDGQALLLAGHGWPVGIVGEAKTRVQPGSAEEHVLRTQQPLAIDNLPQDHRFDHPSWIAGRGVAGCLLVPIYGHTRPLGVLVALTTSVRTFNSEEMAWLQAVANILSNPVERKWRPTSEHDLKMLRAEQMMAIGQVAAGVAHELRNPLTSIKGLVQVNLRDLEDRGVPVEDLSVIEHEIRRMEKTLQTFLDFAKPPRPNRQQLDLAPLVDRVLSLVSGRARRQSVSIEFLRPPEPVEAEVDQDQIQQLVLNLVLNALDANPDGGAIEIELRPARDGYIELYVRDSGPGIAPHILPKVFETFVSSKETGVGLGLPLSQRIAEDHGGLLTAYNLPSAGACFLLRLPVNR